MSSNIKKSVAFACALLLAFGLGANQYRNHKIPFNWGIWTKIGAVLSGRNAQAAPDPDLRFDVYGRLIYKRSAVEVACPRQTKHTLVLVSFGQSNSGNRGAQKFESSFGPRVVNYYAGKCYLAQSPLIGGHGSDGDWMTLLGNKLMKGGTYDAVVLVSTGVGGSGIRRWVPGGDLHIDFIERLGEIKLHYRPTHLIWHQGEQDYIEQTDDYANRFLAMLGAVRNSGISAPILTSVATRCSQTDWEPDNRVAADQKRLPTLDKSIVLAANTDELIENWDRVDGCHFAGTGQEKFAAKLQQVINSLRPT